MSLGSQEQPDMYARTTYVPSMEIRRVVDGKGVYVSAEDVLRPLGITHEDRFRQLRENDRRRTHCYLGGAAISTEQFVKLHPNIELGYN